MTEQSSVTSRDTSRAGATMGTPAPRQGSRRIRCQSEVRASTGRQEIGAPVDSRIVALPQRGAPKPHPEIACRCQSIAEWWAHAARGECTVSEAEKATVGLVDALDQQEWLRE